MDLFPQRSNSNAEDRRPYDCAGIITPHDPKFLGERELAITCQEMLRDLRRTPGGPAAEARWREENTMSFGERMGHVGQNISEAVRDVSSGERSILDISFNDIFGQDGRLWDPRNLPEQVADIREHRDSGVQSSPARPNEAPRQRTGR